MAAFLVVEWCCTVHKACGFKTRVRVGHGQRASKWLPHRCSLVRNPEECWVSNTT